MVHHYPVTDGQFQDLADPLIRTPRGDKQGQHLLRSALQHGANRMNTPDGFLPDFSFVGSGFLSRAEALFHGA